MMQLIIIIIIAKLLRRVLSGAVQYMKTKSNVLKTSNSLA